MTAAAPAKVAILCSSSSPFCTSQQQLLREFCHKHGCSSACVHRCSWWSGVCGEWCSASSAGWIWDSGAGDQYCEPGHKGRLSKPKARFVHICPENNLQRASIKGSNVYFRLTEGNFVPFPLLEPLPVCINIYIYVRAHFQKIDDSRLRCQPNDHFGRRQRSNLGL